MIQRDFGGRWQSIRFSRMVVGGFLFLCAACGGGSGGSGGSDLNIEQPTTSDAYQTDQNFVFLKGTSAIPIGSSCTGGMFGTVAPFFSINWENAANSTKGSITARIFLCGEQHLDWSELIPLEMGENRIKVSSSTGMQDVITVTRIADVTPPKVTQVYPVQTGSAAMTDIWISFNEPIDLSTAGNGNLIVSNATTDQPIDGTLSNISTHDHSIIYHFTVPQALGTNFHLHMENLTDLAGNHMSVPFDATFSIPIDY